MKRYLGFIPAGVVLLYSLVTLLFGGEVYWGFTAIWLGCILFAGVLIWRGINWGAVFGFFPAGHMIFRSGPELFVGAALVLFYIGLWIYLKKTGKDGDAPGRAQKVLTVIAKLALSALVVVACAYLSVLLALILTSVGVSQVLIWMGITVIPALVLPLIWLKKRKKFLIGWGAVAAAYCVALGINIGVVKYDESITVNTSPNINIHEYLPFEEESKIVKYESKTLKLTEDLPVIDGAAALFPVYSAFVNAVYPETTEIFDGTFEYNNTPLGYQNLAEKNTDIFIGVYPSEEQMEYAETCGTTFVYTPIGTEAFVFFVHKDNPIDNLTSEQLRGIYSGEITNWKQVGGKNEKIAAFQRNEGSGSQSMLKRFMGDTPIMEAPTEMVNTMMSGIIEQVSSYRSKSNSIGFSFRYYVEGIIQNPDIKVLSVDGVAPTAENIRNGSYSIVTPIYAVTYEENPNPNVEALLNWILSEEGQYIINETGYVGIAK